MHDIVSNERSLKLLQIRQLIVHQQQFIFPIRHDAFS
jgi:hypothetical protein